jgi:hypothetical protein
MRRSDLALAWGPAEGEAACTPAAGTGLGAEDGEGVVLATCSRAGKSALAPRAADERPLLPQPALMALLHELTSQGEP